jgi:hypothetical protein
MNTEGRSTTSGGDKLTRRNPMIVITVLTFNCVGDGLRDALDPKD